MENRIGIPGDLISMKDGNWDIEANEPRDIDLSGLGLNTTDYFQIAAGASTEIMDGLYLGATLKYLRGTSNLSSQRTELVLHTQGDTISLEAETDYQIRASFPVGVTVGQDGFVEDLNFSNSFSSVLNDFILNKNHGVAIDAGVIYRYTDRLTLSASIVDLGFIRWKSNVSRFDANAAISFSGFDLRQYIDTQGSTDLFQAVVDSVLESFQFETGDKPYFSMLTTKIYAGAQYEVNPKLSVSGLSRIEVFDRRPHLAVTFAGMYSPLPFIHGTLSYTLSNYKLDQLGFGIALGGQGAQVYFVTDHIPVRYVQDTSTGVLWPYNARLVNFRFGVNLIFGCNEKDARARASGYPKFRSKKLCPAYN